MANPRGEHHSSTSSVSHHFSNKLTVIVGSRDTLKETAEHSEASDPQCMIRRELIREVAMEFVNDVLDHACEFDHAPRQLCFADPLNGLSTNGTERALGAVPYSSNIGTWR